MSRQNLATLLASLEVMAPVYNVLQVVSSRHIVYMSEAQVSTINCTRFLLRPSPRPRGSARRKTASSLILRGHF